MTQARRPDGKFGGRVTDISNRDIRSIIRTLDEDMNPPDAKVVLKQPPVKINAKVRVESSLALPEFILHVIVVTAVTIFLGVCIWYVWVRV